MDAPKASRDGPGARPLHEVDYLKYFPKKQDAPAKMILFLGDEKIGKTDLIRKYCEEQDGFHLCTGFSDNVMVISQFLLCDPLDKERVLTRLIELQALESRKLNYPPKVDMVVFCFAVDKPSSFENILKVWLPEAKEHYPDLQSFYLLGLRKDLRKFEDSTPVSAEEARRFHELHKFSGDYMECSVRENRQEAVDLLGKLIAELNCPEAPAVLN